MNVPAAVESQRNSCIGELNTSLSAIRSRRKRLQDKMRLMRRKMSEEETLDASKMIEFQKLNKELRDVKVWEAEFCYTKNML